LVNVLTLCRFFIVCNASFGEKALSGDTTVYLLIRVTPVS
jgi:hypothetical protein